MQFLDFETHGIQPKPKYPPAPIGLAILDREGARYLAFGHTRGDNNSSQEEVRQYLSSVVPRGQTCWHNAKFDLCVAEQKLSVPWPDKWHDTLVMAFLCYPHDKSLSLKELAANRLGLPPEERDELKEWILTNIPEAKASTYMEFLAHAPVDLVGKYAIGDVIRTKALYDHCSEILSSHGMWDAYWRKCRTTRVADKMERRGMCIDTPALEEEVPKLEASLAKVDDLIRVKLNAPNLVVDEKGSLADALEASEFCTELPKTKTGKRSTSYKNIEDAILDTELYHMLIVRGKIANCLRTFARPWLAQALENKGKFYITWESIRGQDRGGARTGRWTSSPNLQNAIKKRKSSVYPELYDLVPNMRNFLIADEGKVLIGRDYSQQELRILAHFEEGALMAQYLADPNLDVHNFTQDMIQKVSGKRYERDQVKTINFGRLYGMGAAKLSRQLRIPLSAAKALIAAHKQALLDVTDLDDDLKDIGRRGDYIKTLGGRCYYVEPPYYDPIGREMRTNEYKLLNYLIQGSAADMLDESVLAADDAGIELLLLVHDEEIAQAPTDNAEAQMLQLKNCMNSVKLDVPLFSDGGTAKSWGQLVKTRD